jgi:hypothetical protein
MISSALDLLLLKMDHMSDFGKTNDYAMRV